MGRRKKINPTEYLDTKIAECDTKIMMQKIEGTALLSGASLAEEILCELGGNDFDYALILKQSVQLVNLLAKRVDELELIIDEIKNDESKSGG